MTTALTTPPPTRVFASGRDFEPMAFEESALPRAWAPSAFGGYYDDARPRPYALQGDVAVVAIDGPLDSRADWWCDGYDAIVARVTAALADPAVRAVLLAIDSPGGACAGNLDAAEALRAAADAAGKPLVAHAGTMACSAAYALACAADRIVTARDALVGSIGVIATVYDRTKANEARGLDVRVIRSGNLKADPHPDVALTDASVARVRARVMELAQAFAAHVAARRPGCPDPLALQGASVTGPDAVTRGLADSVGTLAHAVTLAAELAAETTTKRKITMDGAKALETIGAMRALLKVGTDEEVAAAVATLERVAAKSAELTEQLAAARAELKRRDDAALTSAREAVLKKHRDRGALSEADEADPVYMGSLAGLTPEQLDVNLSRRTGLPLPATKAVAAGAAGTGTAASAGATGARGKISADEQKIARQMGVTDEDYIAARDGKEPTR